MQMGKTVLRPGVVQGNVVLDVQVGAPVTDLGGAFQGGDFQHRCRIMIMDDDVLLVLLDEGSRRGSRNVAKGAIRDRCAGFRREVIACKRVQAFWGCV